MLKHREKSSLTVISDVTLSDLKLIPANEETPELAKNAYINTQKRSHRKQT